MSKKLFVSLASIAATAAFVMAPAVAQAVPHWYQNGCKIGEAACPGPHVATVTWGTLKNVGNAAAGGGTIECHNVAGGYVTNEGGGAGNGLTQEFASYECSGNLPCSPGHEQASPVPSSLNTGTYPATGWPSKLEEEGTKLRVNNTGVEVELGCVEPPEFKSNPMAAGAIFVTSATAKQNPLAPAGSKKGTSAASPGESCFDEGTGELEVKGSGGAAKGRTSGCLKTIGYEEQELVNVKNP